MGLALCFADSGRAVFVFSKSAAAGFEDAKAKLGLEQSRSAKLEKEAAALKKKVR